MKILLLLFFIGCSVTSWAQGMVTNSLEIVSNVTYKVENYPSRLDVFLALQGVPSSVNIIFTPGKDTDTDSTSWEYQWSVNGVESTFGTPNADSTNFTFQLSQDGIYKVEASKADVNPISQTFRVFFVNVDKEVMTTSLLDEDDCDFFKLKLNGYVPKMYDGSYNGSGNVEYTVDDITWINENNVYEGTIARSTESNKSGDYSIKVKDGFGFVWPSQSVRYESVIPDAKPTIKLLNIVDVEGEVGEEMGQAPLEVEFNTDECVNAYTYEWFLYKDTSAMVNIGADLLDSLIEGQIRTDDYFTYIYENTGRYMVKLVAASEERCTDTSEIKYINVVESLVDVPNVFTPNGDGKNDVFMALALSVESFHGTILNRWGRKVYEWSDPTGGWDGRINGRLANPGTYYYIITARGLEKTNTPKYVKKGALMLIR